MRRSTLLAFLLCAATAAQVVGQTKDEALGKISEIEEQLQELRIIVEAIDDDPAPDPDPTPDPAPDPEPDPDAPSTKGIWMSREEIAALPLNAYWDNVRDYADRSASPDVSDHSEVANAIVMAKALVYARTGDEEYRRQVIRLLGHEREGGVIGTEDNSADRTLGPARKICAYVIAADLVDLPADADADFRDWIGTVRHRNLSGKTLISTHEGRPNNWGTSASATRLAIALYLEEDDEVERVAEVFKGWLGDRNSYAGFKYNEEEKWQFNPDRPVGINPKGATKHIDGAERNIDGVLPDDLRRAGKVRWPPPKENYVYGALQGVVATAIMLERAGYDDVWEWEDRAIMRAFVWMHDVADFHAEDSGGDDTHMLPVIKSKYGIDYWDEEPTEHGKIVSFTDWMFGR